MSKIKIKTLTAVHVGSGEFLHNKIDFVEHSTRGDSCIYVIDPEKVLGLIGAECVSNWVSAIERGDDIKEFIRKCGCSATPDQYSLREIRNFAGGIGHDDTLKEALHNGCGVPYIPGSSIKGAIRTAVVSAMAPNLRELSQLVCGRGSKVSAKEVENTLFGRDPKYDVFRFLKVGDAYFSKGCEISSRLINLNIRETKDSLIDNSKSQLVESITESEVSSFQLHLDVDRNRMAHATDKRIGSLPEEMGSLPNLFETINQHTCALLEDEIGLWKRINETKSGADKYVANLQELLDQAKGCKAGQECVLRIGHASGWRFITGTWSESLDEFESTIVPAARSKNWNYEQYEFPKTRRVDKEDSLVFGFVKLSLDK